MLQFGAHEVGGSRTQLAVVVPVNQMVVECQGVALERG